ncbi:MAG TPA: DMT family transporter, partial [Gammaproteobacteria bacterium]
MATDALTTHTADARRGALFVACAALCFASVSALVKGLGDGLPNTLLVFFRSLFGMLFLLPWLVRAAPGSLHTRVPGLHLLRALFGLGALYGYFWTLGRIPLADAVLLTFSAPLFIPFFARLWLGEPVPPRTVGAVLLGLGGLLLILRPGTGLFQPEALAGIGAALCAALALVTVRQLGRVHEPATRVVFYFALLGTAGSAVPLAWSWQMPRPGDWLALVAIGAFATTGQYLLTRGYACAPAGQVGPFSYLT